MTQKNPNKGFHKDLTKIVLENSSQASRDILWTMTSQNLFSQTGQARLLINFRLKILVIKLSAKLSRLSISLAGLTKVILLRVIKVFYKSPDIFFFISQSLLFLGIHAGLFHNIQAIGKTLVPKNMCCSFISFPPF